MRDGAHANQDAWLHCFHNLRKVLDSSVRMRERQLEFAQARGVCRDKTAAIHQPAVAVRLVTRHTFAHHLLADEVGNTDRRTTRAEEEIGVVAKLLAQDAVGAKEASHRNGGGSLNVIVEAADLVAVTRKKRHGGAIGEVFKLNAAARKDFLHGLNEFVKELVVRGAFDPLHAQTGVERIFKERFVVGANIKHHRQRVFRRNACARGVQRKLADWNAHATDAKITKSKDALAISDNDEANIFNGPVAQHVFDVALAFQADIQTLGAAHDVPELLARLAHGGRVDQWHEFRGITGEQLVVESLVAILQFREIDVLVERGGLLLKLNALALQLRFGIFHAVGDQADQAEAFAFLFAEGGALVEARVVQKVEAGVFAFHGKGQDTKCGVSAAARAVTTGNARLAPRGACPLLPLGVVRPSPAPAPDWCGSGG